MYWGWKVRLKVTVDQLHSATAMEAEAMPFIKCLGLQKDAADR